MPVSLLLNFLLKPKVINSTVQHLPIMYVVTSTQMHISSTPDQVDSQSQAIKAAGHVWLSGQIPADVQGNLIQGSTIQKTKAIIENTKAILQEAGSGLDRVVKVVVSIVLLPGKQVVKLT